MLAREPAPLGEALGEVLRGDGVELVLGVQATAARRDGDDSSWCSTTAASCAATTCWSPPVGAPGWTGSASTPSACEAGRHGIPVDSHLRVGDGLWAIGDVTGVRLLTHVGKYQGEVVAANILGEPREAHYEAIPDVVYTDPQAASVGADEAPFTATTPLSEVAKTATYTHALRRIAPAS